MTDFTRAYIDESINILRSLDDVAVDRIAHGLAQTRDRDGRLFVLGVGGSASHASHATNDFRKLCGIEAYCPTDNVSELTARINDDGWEQSLAGWLQVSKIGSRDALLVFSVGGGDEAHNISVNLVRAIDLARRAGSSVYGVVGRDGGYTARVADAAVIIPPLHDQRVTPHTEGLCAVVWHLLVSHPELQQGIGKWETTVESNER